MTTQDIKMLLGAVLARHDEVDLALLFGSRARGAARPESDVDVAVIGRGIDALSLAAELNSSAGAPVDVVDLSVNPPIVLLLVVLREGIKIHENRPGAYGRFLSHALTDLETDLPSFRRMQSAFVERVADSGLTGGGRR